MPSYYGLGTYGTKLYSALNPVSFYWRDRSSDHPVRDLVDRLCKTAIVGNLAPSVVFSGSLNRIFKLTGNLVPAVTFGGFWAGNEGCERGHGPSNLPEGHSDGQEDDQGAFPSRGHLCRHERILGRCGRLLSYVRRTGKKRSSSV